MRTLTMTVLLALTLLSCRDTQDVPSSDPDDTVTVAEIEPEIHTELYGDYVGDFEDAREEYELDEDESYAEPIKISISINYITAKGATGKSAVRGNVRPMAGHMTPSGDMYKFTMDEPGDDAHDGRFEFYIRADSLVGTWKSYDPNVKGPKKKFVLYKQNFTYNPNLMLPKQWEFVDYVSVKEVPELYQNEDGTTDTFINEFYREASDAVYKLNASKNTLSESQVKNLRKLDLEILRNTIFARHGYAFKSRRVRQFFDGVDWYIPIYSDVGEQLTDLEEKNITLLKRYEKYAEDNYDTFGR